jgi:hypothetical protein
VWRLVLGLGYRSGRGLRATNGAEITPKKAVFMGFECYHGPVFS